MPESDFWTPSGSPPEGDSVPAGATQSSDYWSPPGMEDLSPDEYVKRSTQAGIGLGRSPEEQAEILRARGFAQEDVSNVIQQYRLTQAKRAYDGQVPGGRTEQFLRNSLPFGSLLDVRGDKDYYEARQKFAAGDSSPETIDAIARYERLAEIDENMQKRTWTAAISAMGSLPKLFGEAWGAGKVLSFAGGRVGGMAGRLMRGDMGTAASRGVPLASAQNTIGQMARSHAGRMAFMLPLTPSFYLDEARQRNLEEGRHPDDIRGFPGSVLHGYSNLLVLGTLQKGIAGSTAAKRIGKAGAIGVGEQAIVDVAGGLWDEVAPKILETRTKYGVLGNLARGELGEAAHHAAVQFLTFAAFRGLHEIEGRGHAAAQKEMLDAAKFLKEQLDASASKGESVKTAARRLEEVIEEQLAPELAAEQVAIEAYQRAIERGEDPAQANQTALRAGAIARAVAEARRPPRPQEKTQAEPEPATAEEAGARAGAEARRRGLSENQAILAERKAAADFRAKNPQAQAKAPPRPQAPDQSQGSPPVRKRALEKDAEEAAVKAGKEARAAAKKQGLRDAEADNAAAFAAQTAYDQIMASGQKLASPAPEAQAPVQTPTIAPAETGVVQPTSQQPIAPPAQSQGPQPGIKSAPLPPGIQPPVVQPGQNVASMRQAVAGRAVAPGPKPVIPVKQSPVEASRSLALAAAEALRDPALESLDSVQLAQHLSQKLGRPVTPEELSRIAEFIPQAVFDQAIDNAPIPPETKAQYKEAMRSVLDSLSPDQRVALTDKKVSSEFYADSQSLAKSLKSMGLPAGEVVGGVWLGERGILKLDGGHIEVLGEGRYTESSVDVVARLRAIYAHEIGHVMEPESVYQTREWYDIYKAEIERPDGQKEYPLTRYATEHNKDISGNARILNGRRVYSEAFAEFFRLVHGSDVPHSQIARDFPRATEFFMREGLWPAVEREAGKAGPRSRLEEVFDKPITLSDNTSVADTLLPPKEAPVRKRALEEDLELISGDFSPRSMEGWNLVAKEAGLTKLERSIIEMMHGINSPTNEPMSHADIARRRGVTVQSVSKVEVAAIAKLKKMGFDIGTLASRTPSKGQASKKPTPVARLSQADEVKRAQVLELREMNKPIDEERAPVRRVVPVDQLERQIEVLTARFMGEEKPKAKNAEDSKLIKKLWNTPEEKIQETLKKLGEDLNRARRKADPDYMRGPLEPVEHPEERAFLEAIEQDPADQTRRLAYADWLEERDQPERAHNIRQDVWRARDTRGISDWTKLPYRALSRVRETQKYIESLIRHRDAMVDQVRERAPSLAEIIENSRWPDRELTEEEAHGIREINFEADRLALDEIFANKNMRLKLPVYANPSQPLRQFGERLYKRVTPAELTHLLFRNELSASDREILAEMIVNEQATTDPSGKIAGVDYSRARSIVVEFTPGEIVRGRRIENQRSAERLEASGHEDVEIGDAYLFLGEARVEQTILDGLLSFTIPKDSGKPADMPSLLRRLRDRGWRTENLPNGDTRWLSPRRQQLRLDQRRGRFQGAPDFMRGPLEPVEHPEERAFLEAIEQDPADQTRRLAYADWLEERDQPERAHNIRQDVWRARDPRGISDWTKLPYRAIERARSTKKYREALMRHRGHLAEQVRERALGTTMAREEAQRAWNETRFEADRLALDEIFANKNMRLKAVGPDRPGEYSDNHYRPIGEYGERFYMELSPEQLSHVLFYADLARRAPEMLDILASPYYDGTATTHPSGKIAADQRRATGIVFEFEGHTRDSADGPHPLDWASRIPMDQSRRRWQQSGDSDLNIDTADRIPEMLANRGLSVTIKKGTPLAEPIRHAMGELRQRGWRREVLPNGDTRWISPRRQQLRLEQRRGRFQGAPDFMRIPRPAEIIDRVKRGLNGEKQAEKFLRQHFTGPGLLPREVYEEALKKDAMIKTYALDVAYGASDLQKAVGGDWSVVPPHVIDKMNEALADPAVMETFQDSIRLPLQRFRSQMDALSHLLLKHGVIPEPLKPTIEAGFGVYISRQFQVFTDPDWHSTVRSKHPDVVNAFKHWYTEEARRMGEDLTPEDVDGVVEKLLRNDTAADNVFALLRNSRLGAKDIKILTARKDLSEQTRALLGEVKDPIANYANTIGRQVNLLANHLFLVRVRALGEQGGWLSPPGKPTRENFVEIAPGESGVMDVLAGWHTTPEIKEAFERYYSKENLPRWMREYMKVLGGFKYSKTVLSPIAHVRQMLGNVLFNIRNGFAFSGEANRMIREMVNGSEEGRAYHRKLIELNLDEQSVLGGEFKAVAEDALGAKDAFDLSTRITGKTMPRLLRKLLGGAQKLYRYEDLIPKIHAFEHEKAQYRKAHPEWTEAEIEAHAALIVQNGFPTYSRIPSAIKALRRFPLMGPFVSFTSEVVRTTYETAKQVRRELSDPNPEVRRIGAKRLAGLVTSLSAFAALGMMSRLLAGITLDEEDAIRKNLPEWNRDSQLLHLGKDEKGRYRVIDIGRTDPHSFLLEPFQAGLTGARTGTFDLLDTLEPAAKPFISEEIGTRAFIDLARNAREVPGGGTAPVYNPEESRLNRIRAGAAHVWRALEPGFIDQTLRTGMAASGIRNPRTGREYTVGEELLADATGQRIVGVDPAESLGFKARAFRQRLADAEGSLNKAARLMRQEGQAPTVEGLAGPYQESEGMRRRVYDELMSDVAAARILGLSDQEIARVLKGSGLSATDIGLILGSRYTPRNIGEVLKR